MVRRRPQALAARKSGTVTGRGSCAVEPLDTVFAGRGGADMQDTPLSTWLESGRVRPDAARNRCIIRDLGKREERCFIPPRFPTDDAQHNSAASAIRPGPKPSA